MIRPALWISALASLVLFPWVVTASIACLGIVIEPLLPLVVGLLVDTLYYAPGAHSMPFYTVLGLLVTPIAYLVRNAVKTSIIRA